MNLGSLHDISNLWQNRNDFPRYDYLKLGFLLKIRDVDLKKIGP